MNPLKQSYIEVRKADVIASSKKTLDTILNYRKNIWQEKVESYVNSFNNSLWNKLFGRAINYVQAERLIKESDYHYMMWSFTENISFREEEICRLFIKAAEKCEGEIMFLTIGDMEAIGYI